MTFRESDYLVRALNELASLTVRCRRPVPAGVVARRKQQGKKHLRTNAGHPSRLPELHEGREAFRVMRDCDLLGAASRKRITVC